MVIIGRYHGAICTLPGCYLDVTMVLFGRYCAIFACYPGSCVNYSRHCLVGFINFVAHLLTEGPIQPESGVLHLLAAAWLWYTSPATARLVFWSMLSRPSRFFGRGLHDISVRVAAFESVHYIRVHKMHPLQLITKCDPEKKKDQSPRLTPKRTV